MAQLPTQTVVFTMPDGATLTVELESTFTAHTYNNTPKTKLVIWDLPDGQLSLNLVPTYKGATPVAPTVTVTSAPTSGTTATSGTIDFSTSGTVTTTTCTLDGKSVLSSVGQVSFSGLAVGSHTFVVTVTGPGGSDSATDTWTIASVVTAGSPGILLIMMETYGLSDLQGNSQAPFINSLFTDYGFAATTSLGHNSAVNYVDISSGVNTHDGPDADTTIQGDGIDTRFDSRKTIFDQCSAAGDLSVIYTESGSVDYRNPANFFPHITSLPDVEVNRDFPTNLINDLNSSSVPVFGFLIPNNTDNMHSSSIGTGDSFLQNLVGEIEGTTAYKNGLQVVILWDEQDSSGGDSPSAPNGGTVACIVVSNHSKGIGEIATSSTTAGVLGAMEDAFGFSRLGTAAGAPGLGNLLTAVGNVTPPPPAAPVNTAPPVVSGGTVVGDILTAAPGTWTGSPTYGYQWERGGSSVSGATTTGYTLSTADVGTDIAVAVKATNAEGSATATSAAVGPITTVPTGPVPNVPASVASQLGSITFNENWDGNDAITGQSYGATTYGGTGSGKPNWVNPHWAPATDQANGPTSTANVWVQGGYLYLLQTLNEGGWCTGWGSDGAAEEVVFTSGGYFEARLFIPGTGNTPDNWPAWWLVGENDQFEPDVFEGLGQATCNLHTNSGQTGPFNIPGNWCDGNEHTYGLLWTVSGSTQNCTYIWDGQVVQTTSGDCNIGSGARMILNTGNGQYGGQHMDTTSDPMRCKYVRHWALA